MRGLTLFESLFGFIDITSAIFCGLALLFISRKTGVGGLRGMNTLDKLMFMILKTLYSANLIYHIAMICAYYPDILVFDGVWTNWETEKIYAWVQFLVYLTLSTFVYCSAVWLILFWSKLKTVHFLTPLNFLLDLASRSSLVKKIWLTIVIVNFIGHFVIVGISAALPRAPPNVSAPEGFDGRKLLLLCIIPNCMALGFLVLINVPLTVDLIGVIYLVMRSKVSKEKRGVITISLKMILITIFSSAAAALAITNGFREFFGSLGRISGQISPYQESGGFGADQIRKTIGITMARFIYGFGGIIASLPFILRRDFYRIAVQGDITESFNINSSTNPSQKSKNVTASQDRIR